LVKHVFARCLQIRHPSYAMRISLALAALLLPEGATKRVFSDSGSLSEHAGEAVSEGREESQSGDGWWWDTWLFGVPVCSDFPSPKECSNIFGCTWSNGTTGEGACVSTCWSMKYQEERPCEKAALSGPFAGSRQCIWRDGRCRSLQDTAEKSPELGVCLSEHECAEGLYCWKHMFGKYPAQRLRERKFKDLAGESQVVVGQCLQPPQLWFTSECPLWQAKRKADFELSVVGLMADVDILNTLGAVDSCGYSGDGTVRSWCVRMPALGPDGQERNWRREKIEPSSNDIGRCRRPPDRDFFWPYMG